MITEWRDMARGCITCLETCLVAQKISAHVVLFDFHYRSIGDRVSFDLGAHMTRDWLLRPFVGVRVVGSRPRSLL